MKRLIFGISLMTMTVFSACAQRFCPGSDFEVEPVEGGRSVRIVRYVGNSFDVRIPSRIGNLPVTHIGENAFAEAHWIEDKREWIIGHQLTNVTIPNSVTVIDHGAFAKNQLTSVIIPNNVTVIEEWTFFANQLTGIIIPNSVAIIGDFAFNSNKLNSVTIGEEVIRIGHAAFEGNEFASITIPTNAFEDSSFDPGVIVTRR